MSDANRIEEDGYGDATEERRAFDAESASVPARTDGRCSSSRGALEKAKGIEAYKLETAIMTSKIIRLLLLFCLLFACTTSQHVVSSQPPSVMEGTNWIIATGPLSGASVTCKDGYIPTCSYVDGAVKCVCVARPKEEQK